VVQTKPTPIQQRSFLNASAFRLLLQGLFSLSREIFGFRPSQSLGCLFAVSARLPEISLFNNTMSTSNTSTPYRLRPRKNLKKNMKKVPQSSEDESSDAGV
jgi:hypothetical protein